MTTNNHKTIESYEANITAYIEGTTKVVNGPVKFWIDRTCDGLIGSAKILEIGSGDGRNAKYIESKGYNVQRTDATIGFVKLMKSLNQNAKVLNIVTDEIDGNFDLIFADAVLLHLTRDELCMTIAKIFNALNSDGRFSFSLKTGTGEEWSNSKINAPRYFCYWQPQQIEEILIENGFKNLQIKNTDDKWFNILAYK